MVQPLPRRKRGRESEQVKAASLHLPPLRDDDGGYCNAGFAAPRTHLQANLELRGRHFWGRFGYLCGRKDPTIPSARMAPPIAIAALFQIVNLLLGLWFGSVSALTSFAAF